MKFDRGKKIKMLEKEIFIVLIFRDSNTSSLKQYEVR